MLPICPKLRGKGEGMENFSRDCHVFVDIRSFSKLFPELVGVFKPLVKKSPVFLHTEHGVPGGAEGPDLFLHQFIVEGFQGFGRCTIAAQHTGIADEGTADHYGFHPGIPLLNFLNICGSEDVSVIA